jgi:GNAT superfamily N-acetyltransferase
MLRCILIRRAGVDCRETAMHDEVVVRLAVASEHDELEALQERASLSNPGDRDVLLANPDAVALPLSQIVDGRVLVAEMAKSIRGFAAILPRDDGDFDLDALFVDPDSWRRGLGTTLIRHCVNVARDLGSSALHVVGNPHADAFYKACGFEALGTVNMRFGAGILLRKPI